VGAPCAEVAKLRIDRLTSALPTQNAAEGAPNAASPAGDPVELATPLATVGVETLGNKGSEGWRRRESNPGPQVLNDDFYTT
jgi:hypothetical protein